MFVTTWQQASHFETIIGNLQTQVSNLNVQNKSAKPKSSQPTSSTSSQRFTTPTSRKVSASATPSKSPKTPKTPVTPTPPRKKHPLQIYERELDKDFKSIKDALYVHIKMMWCLYKQSDVPPTPSAALLTEFYAKFNSSAEVEAVVSNPTSSDIIAQESILSLKELRASGGKIARGLGHIDQMSILYISGILAKVGIREWAPDLEEAHDSLYNSACRIVCLDTFRQLVAAGTYNYMNIKKDHVNSISHLLACYNHYVHYVMAGRFKLEKAEAGRLARETKKKNSQKYRERLQKSRSEYLYRHRKNVPLRYRTLCDNILAHSDDELDKDKNIRVIKTLGYRSKNANKFFRALDVEMLKEARSVADGKASTKTPRLLPTVPIPSDFTRAPKGLPIDFYNIKWYKALGPGLRRLTADDTKVCFLPDASQSLMARRHPDELICDERFTAKYLDSVVEAYEVSDEENEDGEKKEDEDEDEDEEIGSGEDGDGTNPGGFTGFYEEGEYGDLYDDEEESD